MRRFILLLLTLGLISPAAYAAVPQNPSGLPVPRFVALKSSEVNVRTGPGTRYPIQWIFRREGLPVEITEEFDQWRKIRDMEGSSGWVHKSMVAGGRNVMIKGKDASVLRADPEEGAHPVAKAEPMVLARLVECKIEWCQVQVGPQKGWLKKARLWGVYPQEVMK